MLVLPHNQGKGAAVLHGLREAAAAGFTHVLTMDADGQHPAALIPEFMAMSRAQSGCGDLRAAGIRRQRAGGARHGRKLSNGLANLQTLWRGIGDSLFGFRVYPIAPLRDIMERQPRMRHFDFDAGSRGAPVLARPQADQYAGAGEIFQRRRGRCFAFQLSARQRAA